MPALIYAANNYVRVKGVILVSPYLYPTNRVNGIKKIFVFNPIISRIIFKLFKKKIINNFLKKSSYPSTIPNTYLKIAKKLLSTQALKTAIAEKDNNVMKDKVLKKISEAKIPVAIIWGDKDLTSKEQKQIVPIRRILHPIIEKRLGNAGHAILFTHTKELAEFIRSFITAIDKRVNL